MSANFIKMISEIHSNRYMLQLRDVISMKIPCGFFTGFRTPENLPDIVAALHHDGFNATCVCCTDATQTGGGIDIPIVTLEEFSKLENKPSIMLHFETLKTNIFLDFFNRNGVLMYPLENSDVMERYYDFYIQNLEKLYSVYEMFDEEESKKVFRATVTGKITQQLQNFRFAPEPQYFLEGFLPTAGDIAIDGGAFDGATSRDFAMQGAKVYAFEMSAENYQNCLPRAEKYNFTLENLGLSSQVGEETYFHAAASSRKGSGDLIGKFTDLDSYVLRKDLPRVDYIKLDIEGAELDMLHGAAKTIARWKPKMAVSAYHRPEDLWTLATYIKSIRPDYEFKLRHYKIDCTDYFLNDAERAILKSLGVSYFLSSGCEIVLYCK